MKRKFCVVEFSGMENEKVVKEDLTFEDAVNYVKKNYELDEVLRMSVLVARQTPEGPHYEY